MTGTKYVDESYFYTMCDDKNMIQFLFYIVKLCVLRVVFLCIKSLYY